MTALPEVPSFALETRQEPSSLTLGFSPVKTWCSTMPKAKRSLACDGGCPWSNSGATSPGVPATRLREPRDRQLRLQSVRQAKIRDPQPHVAPRAVQHHVVWLDIPDERCLRPRLPPGHRPSASRWPDPLPSGPDRIAATGPQGSPRAAASSSGTETRAPAPCSVQCHRSGKGSDVSPPGLTALLARIGAAIPDHPRSRAEWSSVQCEGHAGAEGSTS